MAISHSERGKAFEFACLNALCSQLEREGVIHRVIRDESYRIGAASFRKAKDEGMFNSLMAAATAAVGIIMPLEPMLLRRDGMMDVGLQPDSKGIGGDVRDIVCVRKDLNWQMGFSCKHNHNAVKHSRLSATIDFGEEWMGIPCSKDYFNTVVPIFNELRDMRDTAWRNRTKVPLWSELPDKFGRYYMPILRAFLDELRYIDSTNSGVPGKMVQYLIGRQDFYKIISEDSTKTVRVEAMNIHGTLNREAPDKKPAVKVPVVKLPTRFVRMDFAPGVSNTVKIVCDNDWSLSMRIHNASSQVEPSLKFDVQLDAMPADIYSQVVLWRR